MKKIKVERVSEYNRRAYLRYAADKAKAPTLSRSIAMYLFLTRDRRFPKKGYVASCGTKSVWRNSKDAALGDLQLMLTR